MKNYMAIAGVPLPLLPVELDFTLLAPDALISEPVRHHADMILTVFDGKIFCHESYYEANKAVLDKIAAFGGLEVAACDCPRGENYPLDVAFNALVAGKRLICKKDSVCPLLAEYDVINTKQGYAGCTALYAAGTVITADPATTAACEKAGIPVYTISGKDISLPGYDTGFIGGACGACEDTVYIYGDPSTSQSGRELAEFCQSKGLSLVSLWDGHVTDVGGIKFVEKRS